MLESRRRAVIFVGYSDQSKANRLMDNESQNLIILKDVVFDESAKWDIPLKIESSLPCSSYDDGEVVVYFEEQCPWRRP